MQKFPGFRNLDSFTWGDISGILGEISLKLFLSVLNFLLLKKCKDLLTMMKYITLRENELETNNIRK